MKEKETFADIHVQLQNFYIGMGLVWTVAPLHSFQAPHTDQTSVVIPVAPHNTFIGTILACHPAHGL